MNPAKSGEHNRPSSDPASSGRPDPEPDSGKTPSPKSSADTSAEKSGSWISRLFGSSTPEPEDVDKSEVIISAAVQFHVLRVEDVMVPRADIIAVEKSEGLKDLTTAFIKASHSRLPVYNETLDEPTGMVHIKDLLPYLALNAKGRSGKNYPIKKVLPTIQRPVLFVPPSMLAQDLLRRMQARRVHMAIVVDEFGGTDGLVTLEDLVEQIVGDIEDEHDDGEAEIRQVAAGKDGRIIFEADARVSIEDFEVVFGRDVATDDEEEDVDTLGGLIFSLAGRVPERGEIIRHPFGIEFEVIDADPRRVKRLRIQSGKPVSESAAE